MNRQQRRVVLMLREGPKTTNDFRRAGIAACATRIFELKGMEFEIDRELVPVLNQYGEPTHCARYTLIKEPAWAKREICKALVSRAA